ncbi:DUF5689 domain-containing protein [Marseilla massiliensis]|jgi:hypothetical protein|uniref:DUF5689 domain-containing protein n=1 Tax=Marseilla massiliensis TaxID=1841864 RepID=A0A938WSW6_9BACT|nr:DUF5689 domain-containing protein [Marseilla massiliensis]MBM6673518.1 hypothetical protein [Marseilla massiliensis]
MKNFKYIKLVMAALLLGLSVNSCMDDDWDNPTGDIPPYGNNDLQETNVVTIAELKDMYSFALQEQTDTARITENVQIKARVTGNDVGGNIYNQIAVDDGTGALLICINFGGLWSYLPVGQEILVDLKDLYIGTYGNQPQIGTPYTSNSGYTSPSRMSHTLWNEHFKLLGEADASKVDTLEFDMSKVDDTEYMEENCGRLMVVRGITLPQANGERTFAPADAATSGNAVNRMVSGTTKLVVRTSTYADFAGTAMPEGKVDIVGIFTRYRDTWQILMRQDGDFKQAE